MVNNQFEPIQDKHVISGEALKLQIEGPEFVKQVVKKLARTEDCRFSPNGKKLAVAGFTESKMLIFDFEISNITGSLKIILSNYVELNSESFRFPHGLDFLDNETLVIANREGKVTVYEIPSAQPVRKIFKVNPLVILTRANWLRKLHSPGSVCVTRSTNEEYDILICNNYRNRITSHTVSRGPKHLVTSNKIVLKRGLDIPDGITKSTDGKFIAISNHGTRQVFLYRSEKDLTTRSKPYGVLQGLDYPHGIRFAVDDKYLLVADAGLPFLRVFQSSDGDWSGHRNPIKSIRIMSDETFLEGHSNPEEGGLKGIDVSPDGHILATTCELQPLAFYNFSGLSSLL